VRAHSAGENQGATFTVSLPISATRAPGVSQTQPEIATAPIDGKTLQKLRVLVVEDETDTRDLIRRLIEAHGAQVIMAANAREALDLLAKESPNLLISDIGLPGTDGYELIQRIRELETGGARHIPAVALTAFARSEDRTRALRAGYQVHIAKPVEPSELVATLASFAQLIATRRDT
jgi:CheY-like chemotaxis protein